MVQNTVECVCTRGSSSRSSRGSSSSSSNAGYAGVVAAGVHKYTSRRRVSAEARSRA